MLLVAPLLSGFSALIWQILWVRELALVLGGTTQAVGLTTAVFLLGTGIGARIGGASGRGLGAYALCELGIAAWGVATWPILVSLAGTGIGTLELGNDGWWAPSLAARGLQAAVALGLLGLPTLAMGASTPFLAASIARDRPVGRRLGALAAVNTLGAAIGAFTVDLFAIPALGLHHTGLLAAVAGTLAAGVAWVLRSPPPPSAEMPEAPSSGLGIFAFVAGFAAMGFEVLWFRFLGSALGPYRAVFSLLLTVLLVGWAIGAAIGARWRVPPGRLFAFSQASVAILALAGLLAHDNRALLVRQLATVDRVDVHLVNLATVAIVVLPTALAMGVAFAALASLGSESAGKRAGRLWFATTLGNAAGATATTFLLLPALGITRLAALLAGLAALAGVRRETPAVLATAIGALAALAFAGLPADHLVWASFPYGRLEEEGVLAVDEGIDETIVVTGSPEGPARLWTNGHPMSATTPRGQRYMRLLAHVPLLGIADPRDALVICFGVGNTAHAASLHPLKRLTIADISRGVLGQAGWFAHANHGVLTDPRVRVVVDDGRHVLTTLPPESLDLVTLEPPPMGHAGVASLYSRELYHRAKSRLRSGGWLTQWLPAYQVSEPTVRALIGAFVEVFPDGVLLVGAGRELILVGAKDGAPALEADTIQRRLEEPAVRADLDAIGLHTPEDFAALFAADGARLRAIAGPPMTDDAPVAEWSEISHVARTHLPSGMLDPEGWERFVRGARLSAEVVAANRAAWTDPGFVAFTTLPHATADPTPPPPTNAEPSPDR